MFVETKREGEAPTTVKPLALWQQHLLSAATCIEKHGWVQNDIGDEHVGFCYVGAMMFAPSAHSYTDALFKIEKYLGVKDVIVWNNVEGRTKEEVVAAMRACAIAG